MPIVGVARLWRRRRPGGGRGTDLSAADIARFGTLHGAVQEALSAGDLAVLKRLATPAMTAYFAGELARLAREGRRNIVARLELLAIEPCEARREGEAQYATALLRWRAIDYVVRPAAGPGAPELVSGDPRTPVEIEEMWTFARCGAGDWRLSAIHQV